MPRHKKIAQRHAKILNIQNPATGKFELDKIKTKYDRILKYSFAEIYIIDAGTMKFTEVSANALRNLGYTLAEMQKMKAGDVAPQLSAGQCNKIFVALNSGENEVAKMKTVILQYASGEDPVYIIMASDITERDRYEAELKALAFRDPGTDLYNRRYFLEHLRGTINHANRMHSPIGLILIDMDDFSKVNNNYGHIAGDKVISDFANKICDVFSRKTDVVARYGGDEFVVLCIDNSAETLIAKCNQLIARLNKALYYDGHTIVQTASIGICHYNANAITISTEDLINGADIAMYKAKAAGKNQVKICNNDDLNED